MQWILLRLILIVLVITSLKFFLILIQSSIRYCLQESLLAGLSGFNMVGRWEAELYAQLSVNGCLEKAPRYFRSEV